MAPKIAYLSAEFGLDEGLPIYSGGLGVLAGDYVKAASDNDFPLVAVGILYRKGYFRQRILPDGSQESLYHELNRNELPIERVINGDGEPLFIQVPILGRDVHLAVWRTRVGCVSVYLMDADNAENRVEDRTLTDRLYGGGNEERICHEIILGIGGVRCLRAVGEDVVLWHLNEGHVAFSSLERLREYSAQGLNFETAVEAVRATTVFTTHTPVAAGHDAFDISLIDKYLGDFYWQLGADRNDILDLGRVGDRFNMTRLAFRLSAKVNGVSKIHARVSQQLFHEWLPHIPPDDIPVASVTNGVHVDTWLSPELKQLYKQYLSVNWSANIADPLVWKGVYNIPDEKLWTAHQKAKERLLRRFQLPVREDGLFIGFARRFATYKRATLILRDLKRLMRIIGCVDRPVYFIFAGKAHPNDGPGQDLIRRIAEVSNMDGFRGRIFLIEDYDLDIARSLVQGVDVWLNTPLKPMEASGTSGQKAGLNGVLNCSIRDGWWDEGWNGQNGWAIPDSSEMSPKQRDDADSEALYSVLENEIVPLYYARDDEGLPRGWIDSMRESIRTITPKFSSARMLREYDEQLYQPTITRGARLADNGFALAAEIADYKKFIRHNWPAVRILSVDFQEGQTPFKHDYFYGIDSDKAQSEILVEVYLGPIWYQDVQVEAVGSNGMGGIWRSSFSYAAEVRQGVYLYRGFFHGTEEKWRRSDANVRVFPTSINFTSELELELTKWANV